MGTVLCPLYHASVCDSFVLFWGVVRVVSAYVLFDIILLFGDDYIKKIELVVQFCFETKCS